MTTTNTYRNAIDKLLSEKGNDHEIAAKIDEKSHVPRDWRRRGSIPVAKWPLLYALGITAEQLLNAHNASEAA